MQTDMNVLSDLAPTIGAASGAGAMAWWAVRTFLNGLVKSVDKCTATVERIEHDVEKRFVLLERQLGDNRQNIAVLDVRKLDKDEFTRFKDDIREHRLPLRPVQDMPG